MAGQQPGGAAALVSTGALLVRKAGRREAHDYELCDGLGSRLAVARRVDVKRPSSAMRKVTNFFEWTSSLPDTQLEVVDHSGTLLLTVVFSGEDAQFTAAVRDARGHDVGEVVKATGWRKIHFDLRAGGLTHGTVEADGLTGWDYQVRHADATVGRISKVGEGFVRRGTSDEFLLELDRPLPEPLRTLVVACVVGMDVSVSRDGTTTFG